MAEDLASRLQAATIGNLEDSSTVQKLRDIVLSDDSGTPCSSSDPEVIKIREQAVQQLCEAYAKVKNLMIAYNFTTLLEPPRSSIPSRSAFLAFKFVWCCF